MRAGIDLTRLSLDIGRSLDYFAWHRSATADWSAPTELGFMESIFRQA